MACKHKKYSDLQLETAKRMGFGDSPCIAFGDGGKCPTSGCVKKVGNVWRVISNRTGDLWPAHYKTEKDANDALAAYHIGRK